MKKFRKVFYAFLLLTMCFSASIPASAAVKISAKKITLTEGKSKTLKIKGTKKKVKWSSSKKSVATVNSKGKVTAKEKGTATITAKVGNKKYKCKVTVKEKKVVKIVSKDVKLEVGQSATLQISSASKATWKSSNKNVATVTSKGIVKGIKAGKCSVTGYANGRSYTFSVEVYSAKEPQSYLSMGQKNALEKAKDYLSIIAFSRDGLIKQLQFEGYSYGDASYAADHCGANWYEQAIKKAKNYLDTVALSKQGLISQLEFEKFTPEQAQYGAAYCGANWYEQAEKKARQYLSTMPFSKDRLISQLEFEKFTHAEAVYGVERNWY